MDSFFERLTRSQTARSVLVYLGVGWLVLQVVDVLDSLVGLPTGMVRGALGLLVVGLAVVLVTAVAADLGRPGVRRTGVLRFFTWRNAALGGVGAFALWGAVAAAWLGFARLPAEGGVDGGSPRVVAVLPLDNLSADAEATEYFVAGVHEQLIAELAKIPALRVISRTSVMPYRNPAESLGEIATALGADAVVEGSVRMTEERARVTIQLIDAATDQHLWADDFDHAMGDLLDMQSAVAVRVAESLHATLTPETRDRLRRPPTTDPEAQRLYLQGRHIYQTRPGDLSVAIERYREALAIDPDFALAWAGLAEAWLSSAHFGTDPHVAFPKADSAALQALARDPGLSEAHTSLADTRFHYDWNWEAAERGFVRALELNPSHSTGHWFYGGFLAARGRFDEAVRALRRAQEMDPVAPWPYAFGASILYWGRRYDEAEAEALRALEISPDFPWALGALGWIHLARGEAAEAVGFFERAVEEGGPLLPGLASALAAAGREDEARAILARMEAAAAERYVPPYGRAFIHTALGETDAALDRLEEATRTRDAALIWVAVDPAFDPLRGERRFRAVLERMGLEEAAARLAAR